MNIYFEKINPAASSEVWILSKFEDQKMMERITEIH